MSWDIHGIKTWPPGSLMGFKSPEHNAIGIIVNNDGLGIISVVWGANCRDVFREYEVKRLNGRVISRVG